MRKPAGSYLTYLLRSKTAALVPEFPVEDLPSAELQPRFLHLQWRICPWAEHSDDDDELLKSLLSEDKVYLGLELVLLQ